MNENLKYKVLKPVRLENFGFEYNSKFFDWTKEIGFGVELYCQSPDHELWLSVDNKYAGKILTMHLPTIFKTIKELLENNIIIAE